MFYEQVKNTSQEIKISGNPREGDLIKFMELVYLFVDFQEDYIKMISTELCGMTQTGSGEDLLNVGVDPDQGADHGILSLSVVHCEIGRFFLCSEKFNQECLKLSG